LSLSESPYLFQFQTYQVGMKTKRRKASKTKQLSHLLRKGYRELSSEARRLQLEFATVDAETAEILADKRLMASIRQSEREIRQGKTIPWEVVKKKLALQPSSARRKSRR